MFFVKQFCLMPCRRHACLKFFNRKFRLTVFIKKILLTYENIVKFEFEI